MAFSSVSPILFVAVLLAVFESGLCIRCYQCVSTNDLKCKDPFTNEKMLTKDCFSNEVTQFNSQYLGSLLGAPITPTANGPRYCHKIELESGIVIRTCLEGTQTNLNRTCEILASSPNQMENRLRVKHCDSCDTDGCNSASGIIVSLPLAFAALILSIFVAKL